MHAQLHHPPCATGLRTKGSHGPTHAMQHSAGPQASQHARIAGKGRGQGGSLTVRLTREWAYLVRYGNGDVGGDSCSCLMNALDPGRRKIVWAGTMAKFGILPRTRGEMLTMPLVQQQSDLDW